MQRVFLGFNIFLAASVLALGFPETSVAQTLRVSGTGAGIELLRRVGEVLRAKYPDFALEVGPNIGSSGALKAVAGRAIDIAVTARPPLPEEAATGLKAAAFARSPFVVIAARPEVASLSLAELADLYAGRTARWPSGEPVRPVLRPPTDGDSLLLRGMSKQIAAAVDLARQRFDPPVAVTDQDMVDVVARLPGAIGTSTLGLLVAEKRALTPLAIDGVPPMLHGRPNPAYPHQKTLHLAWLHDLSPAGVRLLNFLRSPEGRRLMENLGYTGLP